MSIQHMYKNFMINRTKIKCGCQSGRKVVTHNSKSDLSLSVIGLFFSKKFGSGGGKGIRYVQQL